MYNLTDATLSSEWRGEREGESGWRPGIARNSFISTFRDGSFATRVNSLHSWPGRLLSDRIIGILHYAQSLVFPYIQSVLKHHSASQVTLKISNGKAFCCKVKLCSLHCNFPAIGQIKVCIGDRDISNARREIYEYRYVYRPCHRTVLVLPLSPFVLTGPESPLLSLPGRQCFCPAQHWPAWTGWWIGSLENIKLPPCPSTITANSRPTAVPTACLANTGNLHAVWHCRRFLETTVSEREYFISSSGNNGNK